MAEKKTNYYQNKYDDLLLATINRIERKVDDNTETTEKGFKGLNGRVTKLEIKVFNSATIAWYQDKKLVYIACVCLMVFLLIAAAVLGVKVPGGL